MLFWIGSSAQKHHCYAYKDVTLLGYDRFNCPQCNRPFAKPRYASEVPYLLLEGGREYPDFLQFCGAGRQLFVVSEKTLDLFERHKIFGYAEAKPVSTERIDHREQTLLSPNYYTLAITGKIDLDISQMHIKKKNVCASCGQFDWSRMRIEPILLDPATWDGSDLCSLTSIPGLRVCSKRVKELANRCNLTGLSFEETL